ncbi:MAG: hypothetical protein KC620_02120 [Myxococcales bacterium]|nr:hypothetical protein [Myxococcales bacterium]
MQTHVLDDASPATRRQVAEALFPTFAAFYPGFRFERFVRDYFRPKARECRALLLTDPAGEAAGLIAYCAEDIDVDGDPLLLGDAVTLRRADQTHLGGRFGLLTTLQTFGPALRARRRGRTPVLLLVISSPEGFRGLYDYWPRTLPRPGMTDRDGRLGRWYAALRAEAGFPVDPAAPWTFREGVRFAVDPARRRRREADSHPAVRFFLEHCPDYGQGQEMFVLVPFSTSDLLRAPGRMLRGMARRVIGRRRRR